jgi:hypothetical protein
VAVVGISQESHTIIAITREGRMALITNRAVTSQVIVINSKTMEGTATATKAESTMVTSSLSRTKMVLKSRAIRVLKMAKIHHLTKRREEDRREAITLATRITAKTTDTLPKKGHLTRILLIRVPQTTYLINKPLLREKSKKTLQTDNSYSCRELMK